MWTRKYGWLNFAILECSLNVWIVNKIVFAAPELCESALPNPKFLLHCRKWRNINLSWRKFQTSISSTLRNLFLVKTYERDQWSLPNILGYISGIFDGFFKAGLVPLIRIVCSGLNELRALCPTTNGLCRRYLLPKSVHILRECVKFTTSGTVVFARCSSSFSVIAKIRFRVPPPHWRTRVSNVPFHPMVPVLPPDTHRCFYNSPPMDQSCALGATSNLDLPWPREQGHISLTKGP